MQAIVATAAISLNKVSFAQSSLLSEDDFEAKLLGYHTDASKVDPSSHMRYSQGQHCGNCTWFKGKSSDSVSGCAMYSSEKLVYSRGWCTAWMKQG